MDPLQEYFQDVDLDEIRRFITEKRQEDLHLDFKVVAGGDELEKDDRKNLAIGLSGFANSAGGILVWGVDARPDPDGADVAQILAPVTNVHSVLSQLQAHTGQATSRTVENVLHRAVIEHGQSGYLLTHVPQSDFPPHRAEMGIGRYYRRSGGAFYPLEHFEVEDMFGRRQRPRLELIAIPVVATVTSGPSGRTYHVDIVLGVRNAGRGIARFPSMAVRVSAPFKLNQFGLDGNRHTGLPRLVSRGGSAEMTTFGGGSNDVVHVDSSLEVTLASCEVPETDLPLEDVVIEYRLSAEGVAPVAGIVTVTGKDLTDIVNASRAK